MTEGVPGSAELHIGFGKVQGPLTSQSVSFSPSHKPLPGSFYLNASLVPSQDSLQIDDRNFDRQHQLCFTKVSVEIP